MHRMATAMSNVLTPMPSLMTNRARVFLVGTAGLFMFLAFHLIFKPEGWVSSSYDTLKLLPLWTWGGLMVGAAAFFIGSAWTRNPHAARLTLCAAAVIAGLWTASFIATYLNGQLAGPSGPAIWGYTTFVLLLQVWQPLRVPMEEVIQRESRAQRHGG